jgi:hypothetical protein
MSACPHGDPTCPCQDGLACHYEWDGESPPMVCTNPECTQVHEPSDAA